MQRYMTLLALVALSGAACGSDDADGSGHQGHKVGSTSEECPAGTEMFVTGPSGLTDEDAETGIKARIDWAEYQPPAYDYNTWKLAVTDLDGEPLPEAQFTWACAWMPGHGHGTNPKTITHLSDGLFEIGKQNLSMEGGWNIQFWINSTGTGKPYTGGSEQRDPNACKAPDASQPNIEFQVCVPAERS